jgi:hypothetical protein
MLGSGDRAPTRRTASGPIAMGLTRIACLLGLMSFFHGGNAMLFEAVRADTKVKKNT